MVIVVQTKHSRYEYRQGNKDIDGKEMTTVELRATDVSPEMHVIELGEKHPVRAFFASIGEPAGWYDEHLCQWVTTSEVTNITLHSSLK